MDFDTIALIVTILGSNLANFGAIVSLKNDISDNRVKIVETDQKAQSEFCKCKIHPCTSQKEVE